MKQDEALKQALEKAYLEGFQRSSEGYNADCGMTDPENDQAWLYGRDCYVKEVLEQVAPSTCQNGQLAPDRKLPAQPQQKPLAIHQVKFDEGWIDKEEAELGQYNPEFVQIRTLYTSPPAQRKPLTDEQERGIARWEFVYQRANDIKTSRYDTLLWLLGLSESEEDEEAIEDIDFRFDLAARIDRAIEQAHGIKEGGAV